MRATNVQKITGVDKIRIKTRADADLVDGFTVPEVRLDRGLDRASRKPCYSLIDAGEWTYAVNLL